jgi:adenylate cyclase
MIGSLPRIVGFGLWALLLFAYLFNPAPLAILRTQVLDSYQALNRAPAEAGPIVVIDLDDKSQRRLGQWPWPRRQLAALLDRLQAAGVKLAAFDIVFAEADRSGPEDDQILAASLERLPTILAQTASPDITLGADSRAHLIAKGEDWHGFVQSWPGAVRNIPILEKAAQGLGYISIAQERDGVVRRLPLIFAAGGSFGPALSVEALRLYYGASAIAITSGADGIDYLSIGPITVPTDAQGRLWVTVPRTRPAIISAADVLDGTADLSRLNGRIALIGASAEGLRDLRTLATGARVPGVEIHAAAIDAMWSGTSATRPASAPALEAGAFAFLGLVLIFLAPNLGPMAAGLMAGLSALLATGAGIAAYLTGGGLIDGVTPALSLLILAAGLNLARWGQERSLRQSLRRAFDRYLAPAMIERLVANPRALALGGERREITILFADIRGFTAMAEQASDDPIGLTRILNRVFTAMCDAVLAEQGTIDKMVGDCLIAFWNAPVDQPDHAARAVRAARGIVAALQDLDGGAIKVGIGINTGPCFVGNMGSKDRFNYTALGDAVNIAARLEAATKDLQVDVLIGPATANLCGDTDLRSLGMQHVRGRAQALEVFTFGEPPSA